MGELVDRFGASFPSRARSPRWVGREAEYPLVTADGRAGDASRLWPALLGVGCDPIHDRPPAGRAEALIGVRGDGWECVVEVGRCTVEVITGPRVSIHELAEDHRRALDAVVPAAAAAGLRLLGYGIQPRTPPGAGLLSPKRRYPLLVRATEGRWLWWCVTASDQLHVDVGRDELIPVVNVLNAMSGPLVALTANSSVYRGRPGRFASGREGLMRAVTEEPFRHGAVPRRFADVEDYVRFVLAFRCLFLPDGRGGYRSVGTPLTDVGGASGFRRFVFHDHYWWPSARLRPAVGTVEIRPACQQPPDDSWAAGALALGLAEAHREAARFLEDRLGPDPWPALLRYRSRAVRDGIRAEQPADGFLHQVLDLAGEGLRRRGLGEERYLAPLRERLARGSGPADRARRRADAGIERLISELALS